MVRWRASLSSSSWRPRAWGSTATSTPSTAHGGAVRPRARRLRHSSPTTAGRRSTTRPSPPPTAATRCVQPTPSTILVGTPRRRLGRGRHPGCKPHAPEAQPPPPPYAHSQVLRLFGFGPVVADGFGIGYIIKDECISFCAASKPRQTERYLHTLSTTLAAMQAPGLPLLTVAILILLYTYMAHPSAHDARSTHRAAGLARQGARAPQGVRRRPRLQRLQRPR